MGMAASQARLLSITARMTDNEHSGQAVSYAKIRLADQTEEVNKEYLNALKATKLTVLTGFNGADEVYTDISYALMTGCNTVANNLHYMVTDKKGAALVTKTLADAFEKGNGDFNIFLAELGYTQSHIQVSAYSTDPIDIPAQEKAYQEVHEAWDRYLTSVGLHINVDEEHGLDFGFHYFAQTDANGDVIYDGNGDPIPDTTPFNGYCTYTYTDPNTGIDTTFPLNYDGTTQEQRELYDYAVSLTATYYRTPVQPDPMMALESTANPDNISIVNYYKQIFQKMASSGYYTEDNPANTINDNKWFEQQLKDGKLLLEIYSAVERKFVSTSIDSDQAIQEVTDERELALIDQEYKMKLEKLEAKDNKYDLELRKLDTEHKALQQEYQVLKGVVDKNVQDSFKTFSA